MGCAGGDSLGLPKGFLPAPVRKQGHDILYGGYEKVLDLHAPEPSPPCPFIELIIDKNLLFRWFNDTERSLVCQGDFITTCCCGMGFDSGRVERVAKITSKDL